VLGPVHTAVAATVALVLAALSGLHVYWACGGRWGMGAAVPTRRDGPALFTPTRAATLVVATALAVAAALLLVRGGLASPIGPRWLFTWGIWRLGLAFAARAVGDFRYVGLCKRVRGTPFAARDDRFYTPLCVALAVAVLWLAAQP